LEWGRIGENTHRPFHFEQLWLLQPNFSTLIRQWWSEFDPPHGTIMFQFQQKLKYLKGRIKKWNANSFGNLFQEKHRLDNKMKDIQQEIMVHGYSDHLRTQEAFLF